MDEETGVIGMEGIFQRAREPIFLTFYHSSLSLTLFSSYKAFDKQIQHNSSQNSTCLFCRFWQVDPKTQMEMQGTQNSQSSLEREERGLPFPNLKTYYKATVIN